MEKKIFPPGVWVVFWVLTLLLVGSASVQGATVLYLTKEAHFTDSRAYSLFAAYHSIIYAVSILGGYLGQRFLSQQHAVTTGLLMGVVAFFCLSVSSLPFFYVGLSFHALCVGLVIPNIYDLLGKLYEKHEPARDSAFTIAYTGMNLGALAGFIATGFVMDYRNIASVFLLSGFSLLIAAIYFIRKKSVFIAEIRETPYQFVEYIYAAVIIIATTIIVLGLLHVSFFSRWFVMFSGLVVVGILGFIALKKKSAAWAIFIGLALISVIFWALYMLQSTALVVFIDRNVNREILGFMLPTPTIMSFNPIAMLVIGPLLSAWWLSRSRQNKYTSTSLKFFAGIFTLGISFAFLFLGVKFAGPDGHTALIWVGLFFLLLSVGEMIIAPAGYAMIGILIEDKYHSVMLGVWQLMTGVGTALSGQLAQLAATPPGETSLAVTNPIYLENFLLFILMALITSGLTLKLASFQRKVEA